MSRALALFLMGLGLIAGGFGIQHLYGVQPCEMCLWQRAIHYQIVVIAFIAVFSSGVRVGMFCFIALAAIIGGGVGYWQALAQNGWVGFPDACTSGEALASAANLAASMKVVPSCVTETFTLIGLTLAQWNVFAMIVVLAVALNGIVVEGESNG